MKLDELSSVVGNLSEAVAAKSAILVALDHREIEVFPFQILLLDGVEVLICESLSEHCLMSVELARIVDISLDPRSFTPHYSPHEISDFIDGMRLISDNSIRLVMRLREQSVLDDMPEKNHFGRPCLFTNGEGEYIWAATVEPTDDVFEWIYLQKDRIEVLDPQSFKEDFLTYCSVKVKKVA